MRKFGIRVYGDEVRSCFIGLSESFVYLFDDDLKTIIGSQVKRTRKGFYYVDVFFKRQFVAWSQLVAVD